jgi:hypothetical protein
LIEYQNVFMVTPTGLGIQTNAKVSTDDYWDMDHDRASGQPTRATFDEMTEHIPKQYFPYVHIGPKGKANPDTGSKKSPKVVSAASKGKAAKRNSTKSPTVVSAASKDKAAKKSSPKSPRDSPVLPKKPPVIEKDQVTRMRSGPSSVSGPYFRLKNFYVVVPRAHCSFFLSTPVDHDGKIR